MDRGECPRCETKSSSLTLHHAHVPGRVSWAARGRHDAFERGGGCDGGWRRASGPSGYEDGRGAAAAGTSEGGDSCGPTEAMMRGLSFSRREAIARRGVSRGPVLSAVALIRCSSIEVTSLLAIVAAPRAAAPWPGVRRGPRTRPSATNRTRTSAETRSTCAACSAARARLPRQACSVEKARRVLFGLSPTPLPAATDTTASPRPEGASAHH